MNKTNIFSGLLLLAVILSACQTPTPTATTDPLSAAFSEVHGSVQAKQPGGSGFASATDGLVLQVGGQVQTGADGRARLDLSSGTLLRLAPSTLFTLTDNQSADGSLRTRLQLFAGKIWIILKGGVLDVEVPAGLAAVRGSYMSVEILPDGSARVTCLEGSCSLGNDSGMVNLTNGQAAIVRNAGTPPEPGTMTDEDVQAWLDSNPEAEVVIQDLPTQTPAVPTSTPQATPSPQSYGPDTFPAGYNPLTGEPVADPGMLSLPVVLVSITNFPASARPQAGLSFTPFVFEIFISEGSTRFLAAFYGDPPQRAPQVAGNCEVRADPFVSDGRAVLGNFVWLDLNKDGRQESGEPGVGGVCVHLLDGSGQEIASTTTDSNGYYAFNADAGGQYAVRFEIPYELSFTNPQVGDDAGDSDADPLNGTTPSLGLTGDDRSWDAGLVVNQAESTPTTDASAPSEQAGLAEVGPVRSGRISYIPIRDFFQASCLVYAGATVQLRAMLRGCAHVYGSDTNDINSAFLDVTRMEQIARDNVTEGATFNYTGNLFADQPPAGGRPVSEIDVFYSFLNQSRWVYDAASGSWFRYHDNAEGKGKWYTDTDRLTGDQLRFENVIVLFANHTVISPTIIDIGLQMGNAGNAILFRDGQEIPIQWTTVAGEYEQSTGLRRPLRFIGADGQPVALKPGHTWVHVVTPFSEVYEDSPGVWRVRFYAPAGAK
jgi:hypothetical protein